MMGPMSSSPSFSDVLRLPPGPVDLRSIETDAAPGYDGDKKSGTSDLEAMGDELSDLQERLFAGKADGAAVGAAAPPGHGHLGQGRHPPAHRGPGRPAGREDHVLQGADQGGARPRLPLADPQGGPRPGDHRRLRPVALRGRADRARARAGSGRRDRAALRRDQRVRGRARRLRRESHQVHAAHLARGAEGPAAGPARRPDQALEVQPRRPGRAGALGGLPGGVRDRPRAQQHRGRAVARDPGGQEVVPQPRHRPACCSRPCVAWTHSGRRPTSTSRPRSSGCSTRTRSLDPGDRRRHPLRHPAPRGGQPARHRRGRRPGHLRVQVPRRRPGHPRPGRRGDRQRAGPAARALDAAAGGARPRPRHRQVRGGRGGPGPPQRQPRTRTWASTSCPARSATTASSTTRTTRWAPGSSGSTRSPPTSTGPGATPTCCAGTTRSGSSTTAPRCTSTTAGATASPHPSGSPRRRGTRATTCCGSTSGRLAGVDGEAGDRLGHDVFVEVLAEVPDAWLEPVPGAESPEQLRAAYVAFLDARLATRAWLPLERAS